MTWVAFRFVKDAFRFVDHVCDRSARFGQGKFHANAILVIFANVGVSVRVDHFVLHRVEESLLGVHC